MKSLYALTQKIRQWNQMGLSLLPSLQIAIIHSNLFNHQVIEFLQLLYCKELLYCEKHEKNTVKVNQKIQQSQSKQIKKTEQQTQNNQNNQEIKNLCTFSSNENSNKKTNSTLSNWDNRLEDAIYAIYLANIQIQARVHLIIDQQINGNIDDEDFKRLKRTIERLKRNKSVIFLNFNSSVHKFDSMSEHIERFGLSFKTKQRQIKADELIQPQKQIVQRKTQKKNIQNKINKKDEKQKTIDRPKLNNEKTPKSESKVIQIDPVKQKQITQFESIVKAKLNEFCAFKEINFSQRLMKQIQKKYINLFGVDINKNFNQMKAFHKQLVFELKKYDKFIQLSSINDENVQKVSEANSDTLTKEISLFGHQTKLTKYALNCMHQVIQYLISSLTGTYSTFNIEQFHSSKFSKEASQTRRSIHWETMEIMNEIWDIQGDVLMKQIDKMPVPYIKERYKMLDYQTIGGFMPSSCFHAIFSPPLRKTLQHIFQTLQIIELKILTTTKRVIEYFFDKTNIRYDFSDQQVEQIRKICSKFRRQTQNMLNSQIEFISVSSEDFWTFKQLKSNLYAPDQQAYIEIKYIGKNYVKKVFDNIRETLPRLIGQNLLKQIVFHLQTKSLNGLISILAQTPLQIQITQSDFDFWEQRKSKQKTIDKLIYYFSLKTNSQTSIKNLKQNLDKSWKRTYKTKQKETKVSDQTNEQKNKGFLAWARNLIKGNKKRTEKRSQSQEKKQFYEKSHKQSQNQEAQQEVAIKKHHILSEKNWLLILNINKEVQFQKVKRSSQNGFPEKLRPAIWLYLAKKQIKSKLPKVQHLLNQTLNITPEEKIQLDEVFKQIDKDINRTPPPNLFRKGHLKQSLTRVLRAYSIYDKQLRYTQGMNFICGIILCVLTHYGEKSEYIQSNMKPKMYFQILQNQCYEIFFAMMQNKGLRKIMFIERATITDLCLRLQNYIKERTSIMFEKIQRSGFCIEMIFSGALISGLTTSEINFDLQKRVIDLLITRDFDILYKVIGQFTAASQSLCENMEGENLYFYLKGKYYNDVYNQIGSNGLTKLFNNL